MTKLRISKNSNPKRVASAALHFLRENGNQPVVLSSIGGNASYIMHKTLINLKDFAAKAGQSLSFEPQWGLTEIPDAGEFSSVDWVVAVK